jgi:hypothetical protein
MASQGSKSKSTGSRRSSSKSSNGRRSSSKSSNGRRSSSKSSSSSKSNRSSSKQTYDDYSVSDPRKIPDGPDVLIDVPVVKVDEIDFELDDLRAQIAVMAEVRDMVQLSVGADVRLGKVELKIEGVEAQALLKARLHNVSAILERVALTLDRNPELLQSVGKAVEDVGGGAGRTLEGAGEAVEDVGEGAEGAVQDIGQGAGQGVGQIGQGANQALGQVGQGAGQAVEGVGQGAQQATSQLAQGGGQQGGGQ